MSYGLQVTGFKNNMARDLSAKCRKCRRAGEKLFIKGDRCDSPKCAMVRKAYPPGMHGKNIGRGLSEYGRQLAMKQKIKRIYGVMEKQLKKHFEEIKNKEGVTGDLLIERLEMRLDNVVYRMGFTDSRASSRQLVNHGAFKINGKKVDIPSCKVKINDSIAIRDSKKGKAYFKNRSKLLREKKNFPAWINFDGKKMEGKIIAAPTKENMETSVNPQLVVEYYSR